MSTTSIVSPINPNLITTRAPKRLAEVRIQRLREVPIDGDEADSPARVAAAWESLVPSAPWWNPDVESLVCFTVNTRRRLTGFYLVSMGTLDSVMVHAREVFKTAIVMSASGVILAHNHPSGDPTPSEGDIKVTRDLIRAGQLLKIDVLDHLIIGAKTPDRDKAWYSLREGGYFYL